jgi:hypothetical protein
VDERFDFTVHSIKACTGISTAVAVHSASDEFRGLDSDERFAQVLSAFEVHGEATDDSNRPPHPDSGAGDRGRISTRVWRHSTGTPVMQVKATDRAMVISIDNRAVPGFGEYLLSEMEKLVSAYLKQTASAPAPVALYLPRAAALTTKEGQ